MPSSSAHFPAALSSRFLSSSFLEMLSSLVPEFSGSWCLFTGSSYSAFVRHRLSWLDAGIRKRWALYPLACSGCFWNFPAWPGWVYLGGQGSEGVGAHGPPPGSWERAWVVWSMLRQGNVYGCATAQRKPYPIGLGYIWKLSLQYTFNCSFRKLDTHRNELMSCDCVCVWMGWVPL